MTDLIKECKPLAQSAGDGLWNLACPAHPMWLLTLVPTATLEDCIREHRRAVAERTGQLIGGPDEGNLVTATVDTFRCEVVTKLWIDGPDELPDVNTTRGAYHWSDEHGGFRWVLDRNKMWGGS